MKTFWMNRKGISTKVLDFIELESDEKQVAGLTSFIKNDRKFAFIQQPDLVNLYDAIKDNEIMVRLGYNNLS